VRAQVRVRVRVRVRRERGGKVRGMGTFLLLRIVEVEVSETLFG
jgi:hypothetical protein